MSIALPRARTEITLRPVSTVSKRLSGFNPKNTDFALPPSMASRTRSASMRISGPSGTAFSAPSHHAAGLQAGQSGVIQPQQLLEHVVRVLAQRRRRPAIAHRVL